MRCSISRVVSVVLGTSLFACSPSGDAISEHGIGNIEDDLTQAPMYLTGAFDGCAPFRIWIDSMQFARAIRAKGKAISFSYFINGAYYTSVDHQSSIGRSWSEDEATIRWALTQQAVNEGHEIANHTFRHLDGTNWTQSEWEAELKWMQDTVATNLFMPVKDGSGQFVFPRWVPSPVAKPGTIGASCTSDSACLSNKCVKVTPSQGFCSTWCGGHDGCTNGTVCGGWTVQAFQKDVCVPKPAFPVVYQGVTMFGADGKPNLSHPALKPYKMFGFRAPYLARNAGMYAALAKLGLRYDTSQILPPQPPSRTKYGGVVYSSLWQFALMQYPGSWRFPMDYNYWVPANQPGSVMLNDYKNSIVSAYTTRNKEPWNVGHHMKLMRQGEYWRAMRQAFTFAAEGCVDPTSGAKRCPDLSFPSFRQLAYRLSTAASTSTTASLANALRTPADFHIVDAEAAGSMETERELVMPADAPIGPPEGLGVGAVPAHSDGCDAPP